MNYDLHPINLTFNSEQQQQIFKYWKKFQYHPSNKSLLDNTTHAYYTGFLQGRFLQPEIQTIDDIFSFLKIETENINDELKIKSIYATSKASICFFSCISQYIKLGSYITLEKNSDDVMGLFFNQDAFQYKSFFELEQLRQPFYLSEKLTTDLVEKDKIKKHKI